MFEKMSMAKLRNRLRKEIMKELQRQGAHKNFGKKKRSLLELLELVGSPNAKVKKGKKTRRSKRKRGSLGYEWKGDYKKFDQFKHD